MSKIDPGDNNQQDRVQVLDDEKKRALDLYSMKLVPPETVLIFDEPTRCYRINKEWAAYVMGMVSWLAEIAPWRDAVDESYFAIEEIQKFLAGVECMAFGLRQKPDDSCILQQTLDGETWSDVFDFSQCVTIQDKSYQISIQNQVTNVQETFIDIYNNFSANYAGLPSDVYPALSTPTGDDSALKAALCNAIWEMIRVVCEAAISYYRENINQSQQEAQVLLAIGGFALAMIALAAAVPTAGASLVAMGAAAPYIAAGVGLGAGLANFLVDDWQEHTIDQFQDTEAREEVACYLVDELEPGDKSLAELQAALVGHGLTGNAAVIADSLSIMLQNDGLYAAFLEKWNNNLQFADAGIDLYCPCATEYRVWTWDFSNGMGPFSFDVRGGSFAGGRVKGTGDINGKQFGISMDFNPSWIPRAVKLYMSRSEDSTGIGNNGIDVWARPTPGSDVGGAYFGFSQYTGAGDFTLCTTPMIAPFSGANQFDIFARITKAGTDPEIYLDKITIVFEADYAKGGYITDDLDICS